MAEDENGSASSNNDLWWVFGIFIVLGLLWFVSGGPQKEGSSGLFVGGNNENKENNLIFERGEDNRKNTIEISEDIKDIERELEQIQDEIDKAREEKEKSPLYGVASVDTARSNRSLPDEEYVRIKISNSLNDKIIVSGWELYSPLTGNTLRLNKAVLIPKIGEEDFERPIVASPGDTIIVSSGRSPIGISFRTNMCTGYLEQFQDFYPSLKKNCPDGDDEARFLQTDIALGESCMSYLRRLPRCEVVANKTSGINSCDIFVESNLNYNSCVENHFGDTNFPGNEWRIYMGSSFEIWRNEREVIKLLDPNGKTIDIDSYN